MAPSLLVNTFFDNSESWKTLNIIYYDATTSSISHCIGDSHFGPLKIIACNVIKDLTLLKLDIMIVYVTESHRHQVQSMWLF